MSEHALQLVSALRGRLHAVIRRITRAEILFGVLVMLGTFAMLWLVAVAFEASFWLGTTTRSILFWICAALLLGVAVYYVIVPCLRLVGILTTISEEAIARRIGIHFPDVSDRLINLLQLASGRRSDAPNPFVDHAVAMLNEEVRHVPFEAIEDFRRARQATPYVAVPILGILAFSLLAPSTFWDATTRVMSPGVTFTQPAPFQFNVAPGSTEIVRGATVDLRFTTSGSQTPDVATLAINNIDEEREESIELVADSTGTFEHTLVNVRTSFRYRVASSGVASPWYTVTVVERPIVRGLQVSLTFPSYTDIPPQRLDPNVGDITALPGTQVEVEIGVGGQGVEAAYLRFGDGTQDSLALDGTVARGTFQLRENGTYAVVLRNDQNLENSDPITYTLALVPDAHPSIALIEPEPLTELNEARRAQLRMRLNDDFGFNRLRLFYRLAESRFGVTAESFESLDLPLQNRRQLDQEVVKDWLLSQETNLDPVPGDVIEYYVQVWDNDVIAGFKSARSGTQRLRLPSLLEQYEALDEQQDTVEETIEDLVREADEVREQFEELRDELRQNPESDWEDERQIEQLQERQQQLEQQAEELSRQVEDLTQQMEDNNLVSEETLEMHQELQKVVEEINSPELQEALQDLRQSMENLDMQQMQEAIQNFEFNENQYQQRLERALELFEQLRVQQELEEAARRAEELAKQQERLAEQTKQLEENEERPSDQNAESPENQQENTGEESDENQPNEASEQQEGLEQQSGEQQEGEQQSGEQQSSEQQNGEQQEAGDQQNAESQDSEQLAREQEQAAQEMQELLEQLEDLQEHMQDVNNAPSQQMEQMRENAEQMPQQMQENAEQLRQNELNDAQQGQQQMQQQLQQMQSQLSEMQQGMQGQQMQVNMAGLRQALDDILTLSQQQETLREGVRGMASDSPQLRDFAQQQVELSEDLTVVTDSLQKLANDIPQMSREVQQQAGEALMEMGAATAAMTERIINRASGHQKDAMTHLNELALLLSDLMNQLMNMQSNPGQGGGGMSMQQMLQQLQQMSQQQQQLNNQIQQMLNDMQGNRLTQDMQSRLNQMAAQQEMMRRQLRQMNRNPELRGKALGDLQRIAEQMQETINELQNRQVNRRTIDRQQQILQRLLNAAQSMNERGRERRREGQTGDQFNRDSPAPLTPQEEAEELRRALLKALESGYAPDYEELIKRYFELLQQQSQDADSNR